MPKKIKVYFAPLQGFTDAVYRKTHGDFFSGVNFYFAPFVSMDNIKSGHIKKYNYNANEIPQIIVSDSESCKILVDLLIEKGFKNIDINFGCPFVLQTKKFRGSGILPYPERVSQVFKTIENYSDVNFSLKMRLGLKDDSECLNLVSLINSSPIKTVTIHPRTGVQQYLGVVDNKMFEIFTSKLIGKNIVFNGDISTAQDIENLINSYPFLSAVMCGRGLLKNPALADVYKSDENDENVIKNKFLEFNNALIYNYLEEFSGNVNSTLVKLKSFWDYFLPTTDVKVLKKIKKSNAIEEYRVFSTIAINNFKVGL